MPRHIEMKPPPAKQPGLDPIDVGNRDEQGAGGRQKAANAPESSYGIAQMLQAMPECDAIEYRSVWDFAKVGDNIQASLPGALGIEFRPLNSPAALPGGKEKAAVAAANIEQLSRLPRIRGFI